MFSYVVVRQARSFVKINNNHLVVTFELKLLFIKKKRTFVVGVDEVTSVLYVIRLVYFLFDRLRKRNDQYIRSYTTLDSEIVLVLKNENETETGQDLLAEKKMMQLPDLLPHPVLRKLTNREPLKSVLHKNLIVFKTQC